MRYALAVVLLVACSSSTVTVTPAAPADNDARICQTIETGDWNADVIEALTADSTSTIATQAKQIDALFHAHPGSGEAVQQWNALKGTCIDAGY